MTNLTQMVPNEISMCALYQTYSRQVHGCEWKEINLQHHDLSDFGDWLFEAQQQSCEAIEAPPEEQVRIVAERFCDVFSPDEPFEYAAATLSLILMTEGPKTDYGTMMERISKEPLITFPYPEPETPTARLTTSPQVWWKRRHHNRWLATGSLPVVENEELPQPGEIIMARIRGRELTEHEVLRYAGQDQYGLPMLYVKTCKTPKNDVRHSQKDQHVQPQVMAFIGQTSQSMPEPPTHPRRVLST